MQYLNYFNNLNEFKSKKEILLDLKKIYNVSISDNEYNNIILSLLNNNIIDKSSNNNKCKYISLNFLKSNKFSNGIEYYKSLLKINNNIKEYNTNFIFNRDDCLIELNLTDLL